MPEVTSFALEVKASPPRYRTLTYGWEWKKTVTSVPIGDTYTDLVDWEVVNEYITVDDKPVCFEQAQFRFQLFRGLIAIMQSLHPPGDD